MEILIGAGYIIFFVVFGLAVHETNEEKENPEKFHRKKALEELDSILRRQGNGKFTPEVEREMSMRLKIRGFSQEESEEMIHEGVRRHS